MRSRWLSSTRRERLHSRPCPLAHHKANRTCSYPCPTPRRGVPWSCSQAGKAAAHLGPLGPRGRRVCPSGAGRVQGGRAVEGEEPARLQPPAGVVTGGTGVVVVVDDVDDAVSFFFFFVCVLAVLFFPLPFPFPLLLLLLPLLVLLGGAAATGKNRRSQKSCDSMFLAASRGIFGRRLVFLCARPCMRRRHGNTTAVVAFRLGSQDCLFVAGK